VARFPNRDSEERRDPPEHSREPAAPEGVPRSRAEPKPLDPAALVEAVRRGSADAFEVLAREHSPRLYRLALHLSRRPDEAEDLVQETLVRALPALRRFEGRAQLSTYLIRALTNLWKNRLRSRSRSRIVDWFRPGLRGEEAGTFDPPDASASALDRIEAEEAAARVRTAMARLDPDRRLTLLLREVEDLSYEEIASVTGVPIGTVRSRISRAREDLRRLLRGRP